MAIVLITGSNRGIGLAMAREFLRQGDRVVATARDPEKAEALRDLAEGSAGALRVERLDVGGGASVERLREAVEKEWGQLDILVNNAAVFPENGDESLEELDLELFHVAFAINVVGLFARLRLVLANEYTQMLEDRELKPEVSA